MKKVIIPVILLIMICFSYDVIALDMGKIIAYPVPYNPKKGSRVLNVGFRSGSVGNLRVKFEIFDVNGDLVFKRRYGGLPVVWNGHNDKGNLVMPGFYIVKIDVEENSGSHSQGKKILRILINY